MPVSLLLVYTYAAFHDFFHGVEMPTVTTLWCLPCVSAFFTRDLLAMTFDFHQFDFGTLFSQEGRINEGGRILKLLLAKISDKSSTVTLCYSIYVKTFYCILLLYLLCFVPRTFFLFRYIEYLITVYIHIVIAIYRAELFPSLSVNRFIVFTDLQVLFVRVYNFMIGLWIVWDFPEHRWD